MRRVCAFVLALMLVVLLAGCVPAGSAPTTVPPTVTTALTRTLTPAPTATQAPTLPPTEVSTLAPTQEDFSNLPYAKTFKEALDLPNSVTEEDILSGRLILHAKTLVKPFDESIPSPKVAIRELPGSTSDR